MLKMVVRCQLFARLALGRLFGLYFKNAIPTTNN